MKNYSIHKLFFAFLLCGALLAVGCEEGSNGTNSGNGNGGNGNGSGGEVTLDYVDGLDASGGIKTGVPITFYIRLNNNTGYDITGSTNGFRVYSPDGAQWEPITGDTASVRWDTLYDGGTFIIGFDVTGSDADTIGFGGFSLFKPGIPDGFDEVTYLISTQVDPKYDGHTLCIDSSFYQPGGTWMLSTTGGIFYPNWDGARCFRIVNPAAVSGRESSSNSER